MEQEWTLPSSTVSKKAKQVRQTELISVSKGNKLWRKAPLKHLQAVRSPLCERTALPFKRHALSGIHSRTAAAHGNTTHGPPCTGTHPCPATTHGPHPRGPTSTRPPHARPARFSSFHCGCLSAHTFSLKIPWRLLAVIAVSGTLKMLTLQKLIWYGGFRLCIGLQAAA